MKNSHSSKTLLAILPISLFVIAFLGVAPVAFATKSANCSPTSCNLHDVSLDLGPLPGGVNACNGQPVATDLLVSNGNLQIHTSADGSHTTATIEGTFYFSQTNGVSYSGHGKEWFGTNVNKGGTFESTSTSNIDFTGTDGSVIHINAVTHLTVTPAGVVTANVDSFNCH